VASESLNELPDYFLLLKISKSGSLENAATSGISVYPSALNLCPEVIGTSSKKLNED